MKLLKTRRVTLVALLGAVTMGALSFLPGSLPLGSQVAGAAQPTTLVLNVNPNPADFGAPVTFTATLSGGLSSPNQPTGSISLAAYTVSNCSSLTPAFTLGNAIVNGNGTYTVGTTTPVLPGTYYGNAYFADTDGFNSSASSGSCVPILVVNPNPTTLTLQVSPNPAAFGTPVTFTGTLSGGLSSPNQPTGSISLAAYTVSNCSSLTPAFTLGNAIVNGNGAYTIGTTTPVAPGTYYGEAYFADTDGFNTSASSGSCVPILVVNPPAPAVTSLTLQASPNPANSWSTVTFNATLSGGGTAPNQPVGQISLGAYTTPNCSNNTSFTLAVNVNGNGTYTVGTESHLAPGTYYGNAYFADTDGNNTNASSGQCGPILVVNPPHSIWWWIWWFLTHWHF